MTRFSDEDKANLFAAALVDCWERGCTCRDVGGIKFAILSEGPPRVKIGIEHLQGCPLWSPRDLDSIPPNVEPDSLVKVKLS